MNSSISDSSKDNITQQVNALVVESLMDILPWCDTYAVKKPWGYQHVLNLGDKMWIKVQRVEDGHRVSLQHHQHGTDMIVILDGTGTVLGTEDDDDDRVRPSRVFKVRPYTIHRAIGPITLLEFTTASDDDIVRHEDDYGREGTSGL